MPTVRTRCRVVGTYFTSTGWWAFTTDEPLFRNPSETEAAEYVLAGDLMMLMESRRAELSDFGKALLAQLGLVEEVQLVRYVGSQVEIFGPSNNTLANINGIMAAIAGAYGATAIDWTRITDYEGYVGLHDPLPELFSPGEVFDAENPPLINVKNPTGA